ncbi:hypothetical protein [Methylobacterium sp. ARG-1]|uniref:hypothetical protein n=1 Tax=Methylobacterium sp. ARG-1 TaxID=1692501 RepID=UPI00067FCD73|nr:hypothetical protein [Methylobacterium sp. ARG-1]KNY20380.1 hypothetical protein AKJ13_22385 [Methylobacterium sp. ARG-1]
MTLIRRASAVALMLPDPHRYRFRIQDIAEVMRRWAAGHDTAAIAAATGISEPDVARIVHADADRRHTARAALKRI